MSIEVRPVHSRSDLMRFIDVPVEVARARLEPARADRLERLGQAFQDRVHDGYQQLAGSDPGTWVIVDGTGGKWKWENGAYHWYPNS